MKTLIKQYPNDAELGAAVREIYSRDKLRLLITKDCNRSCKGCCNKDWDLDKLPICTDFRGYSEVILTGGEPMLYPDKIINLCKEIRKQNNTCKIYLYTADIKKFYDWYIDNIVDGVTVTLHEQRDVVAFKEYSGLYSHLNLRLNVFKGIKLPEYTGEWIVQRDIVWIKDCPLPKGEVFMRVEDI